MLKLIEHLAYINQRKRELEEVNRHKLINMLVIKELELKEYEKEEKEEQMVCDYCEEPFDDCQCGH